MDHESLEFLKALANVPSPSGYEQGAAKLFREYTQRYADRVSLDSHGNIIAAVNPDAPMKIMLAAHMDEIGFVVHYIDEAGLLYFSAIGGHDSTIPPGQRVWVYGSERTPGVVGRKASHLLDEDEQKKKPKLTDLWIDIGATSRAQAEAVVRLGDPITYQYEFQSLLGDRAAARGFDNKAGLFVVAEALRSLSEEGGLAPGVGVYFVASVQEEIGSRGARTSAFSIAAQTGLAIDVDHAIDYPGVSKTQHGELKIGEGPSVSRGPNTNPVVFDLLSRAAKEEGIPFQVSVSPSATPTDANAMQLNREGMAVGLVGIAIRYMHTPCELLSLTDLDQCIRLTSAYCRRVTRETDFSPY
ncbi:M42 family metallopeptidase [Methylobacterium sp. R2-1]|uniref:M42 family metallopeptidase n=1 Tax=Methylobacterium sp. R2-1 TaxID=2587064 RepID=UPI001613FEFC|nr:M42 family metallopeptidase [Methylobacterium sp. R2-1]MBB2962651.1 endoglucanase [Methylobacterium sp. R2-1]